MSKAVHHHLIPFKTYVNILGGLFVLTILTVAAGLTEMDHVLHILIAMAIATVKAVLVASYFMHLKYDDKLFRVILVGSVFFLLVMFTFCMADIFSRPVILNDL